MPNNIKKMLFFNFLEVLLGKKQKLQIWCFWLLRSTSLIKIIILPSYEDQSQSPVSDLNHGSEEEAGKVDGEAQRPAHSGSTGTPRLP
ncbi:MAG: hypothetical protein Q8738_00665, partial [Candidatus Phytoplasma australasiaticum]|nr:hypothetical protein [Candidatus Phytoplasma australasiaticum]